jgi:hypothetical protein
MFLKWNQQDRCPKTHTEKIHGLEVWQLHRSDEKNFTESLFVLFEKLDLLALLRCKREVVAAYHLKCELRFKNWHWLA